MPKKELFVLALLSAITWFAPVLANDSSTVLLTFEPSRIGPRVPCDGTIRVTSGRVVVREWLHEEDESIEGTAYRVTTSHDARTAETVKKGLVRSSLLPKGLLLDIDAPPSASLSMQGKLGDFSIELAKIRRERVVSVLDGKVTLKQVPRAAGLGGDQAEEEYASLAVLRDGRSAVAYIAWDGNRDRVLLRVGDEVREISAGPGEYLEPRCAVDGQGRLRVVWTANDGGQWNLWSWCEGQRQKLTGTGKNHFWPRAACDRQGRLWLVWQTAAADLHYEIQLAELKAEGLGPVLDVSEDPGDDWEPAICITPDQRLVVAWDTYRNGNFDVYLREYKLSAGGQPSPLGPPRAVAASPKREAHVTVAADSKGRVWLAWDTSNADWGKHPQGATLHSSRATDVACYSEGRFYRPGDFMGSLPKAWARFVEYPQMAVDGEDRPWLLYRVENVLLPLHKPARGVAQVYGMWVLFASSFDGEQWSEPILLDRSSGRQDMRVDVARDPAGRLRVAYGGDNRTRKLPYVPVDYDVFLASLPEIRDPMRGVMKLTLAEDLGTVAGVTRDPELAPLPREWIVGKQSYRLVLGDTHRHTDISRCSNGRDGSLQDAYRYALDACGLEWLAISDHDQDILRHRADRKLRPRQDYDWWRSQKYCDLYTIPGRFVALYGYEHGGSYSARGGHKNVVGDRRGLNVEEVDAPHELFAALADSGCMAIPHQLADGGSRMDWEKWNAQFERVGEIFQARGGYEFEDCPRAAAIFTKGNSLWDALAKGVRIGIIASSDHGQTHQARAGAYVEAAERGFTRAGILAALRARRTFGATTAVAMQVRIGDHVMGEEFDLDGPPAIDAKIVSPLPITRVDVVRDNRFVYTAEPSTRAVAFRFQDRELAAGRSAYYYLRANGRERFCLVVPAVGEAKIIGSVAAVRVAEERTSFGFLGDRRL